MATPFKRYPQAQDAKMLIISCLFALFQNSHSAYSQTVYFISR